MATWLKFSRDKKLLEVGIDGEMISLWCGYEQDVHYWVNIKLTKDDAIELIAYLQKLTEQIDGKKVNDNAGGNIQITPGNSRKSKSKKHELQSVKYFK